MRKRLGQAARSCDPDGVVDALAAKGSDEAPGKKDKTEKSNDENADRSVERDTTDRVFSWFDLVRSGAQLTLDVIRVIREATDLYRKLYGGRGGA